MPKIGIGFRWGRAADGYEVVAVPNPATYNPALPTTALNNPDEPATVRAIMPRSMKLAAVFPTDENRDLFLRFANLARDLHEHKMVAFADQYGLLSSSSVEEGETVSIWRSQIKTMAAAVQAWSEKDFNYLRQFRWDYLVDLRAALTPGHDARGETLIFSVVPPTLLSAIWLQFAQHISGNLALLSCEQCRNWFDAGGRGPTPRFCSTKCRNAHNNAKRRESRT